MTSTPVGMRCPECARQRTRVKHPGGVVSRTDAPFTFAIVAICVAAFVAELVAGGSNPLNGGGRLIADGGIYAAPVADGEYYRIVTYAFLHAGLLHIGFNLFALYVLGSLLEPVIGTIRFAGIYIVSILAGALGSLVVDPNVVTVGASGGIFGIMVAAFLIARDRGMDELASQVGFFVVINLVLTFTVSGISVGGHIGGIVGGGLATFLILALDRSRVANARTIEIAGMVVLGAVAIAGAVIVADANAPAALPRAFG